MNLLEINVFILWFQSEVWNDACGNEIAIFSYQRGEKMYNFITTRSACLAGKREGVHFVPNPFDWVKVWEVCLRLVFFWCCERQGYSLGSFPAIGASMSSVIEAEKVFWKRVMRSFEKIFWRFLRVWYLPWVCDSFLLDIFLWRTSVFSCALKFPGCEGQVFNAEEALKAERVRERWLPNFLGQAGLICSFYDIDMIRLLGKFLRKFGAFFKLCGGDFSFLLFIFFPCSELHVFCFCNSSFYVPGCFVLRRRCLCRDCSKWLWIADLHKGFVLNQEIPGT